MVTNYPAAPIDEATRAILDYAVKLTRTPARMEPADIERLRGHGLSDRAISDAVQIISYFNYINRVADGLGVDLEPEFPPRGK